MEGIFIRTVIICSFFIWGAYATTDILRLLKGAKLQVWKSSCYCPICGTKIRLINQIPVFSYVCSKGKCRKCNNRIPLFDLCLELSIIIGFTVIALYTNFSWKCLIFCIVAYEMLKILCICVFGRRVHEFAKNLIYSMFSNIIIFLLISFLFLLRHIC